MPTVKMNELSLITGKNGSLTLRDPDSDSSLTESDSSVRSLSQPDSRCVGDVEVNAGAESADKERAGRFARLC